MPEVIEQKKPAAPKKREPILKNPPAGSKLQVLRSKREIHIISDKHHQVGWEKQVTPAKAYEMILGKRTVKSGEAMLLFWHNQLLMITLCYEVDGAMVFVIDGQKKKPN